MNEITLTVWTDGRSTPLSFPVRRMVNAGYVGRDQAAVRTHIEELAHEGVPPPRSVPMVFPITTDNLTTDTHLEVLGDRTSGEVEYVLLLSQGEVYVTVGSDHTDRALERQSVAKSKQICRNVLATECWRYGDVHGHWDELLLQSWVRDPATGKEVLYQKAPLAAIIPADDLLTLVRSRITDGQTDGLVIYSGTIPVVAGRLIYADSFRGELIDARLGRRLAVEYKVTSLNYLDGAEV